MWKLWPTENREWMKKIIRIWMKNKRLKKKKDKNPPFK
jgi:hypothetical protein